MNSVYSTPRRGKLSGSFRPYYPASPNYGYSIVQEDTQQTSEGLYRQTTIGKLMVDSLTRYVVGRGLTPMSAPESDIIGWSDEQLSTFRRQAESYWRLVTDSTNFDYYGKDNFKQLQQIAFKNIIISGDTLRHNGFRKLRNGSIVPYVQVISGRMVSQEWIEDTCQSVGGVIISRNTGKEVGYCIRILNDSLMHTGQVKRVNKYSPNGRLEFDLISIAKSDPALIRGIPLLSALRDDILDFNAFKSNHIVQSAVQSMFTVFIEKTEEAKDDGISFIDKLAANGAEQVSDNGEGKIELGPAYVCELNNGEKANLVQSSAQGDDFDAFTKAVVGLIASSLGMSYEVAMNAYSASFSASRASISGAEKNFAILREEFATKFCNPVWDMVIEHGILTGNIECPDWESMDSTRRHALLSVTWTGVTPPQVDPTKEVNAYALAIQNGLCTREYAIRQLYGMDFEEVAERIAEEHEMLPTADDKTANEDSEKDSEEEEDKEEDDE